jgi:uncharacterized coiled-coil protein SlyX
MQPNKLDTWRDSSQIRTAASTGGHRHSQPNRNKPMKRITNISDSALSLFALACFALAPQARAVCQEGCNTSTAATFLGEDALVNNTGTSNTAIGNLALTSNTSGAANTAIGSVALFVNSAGNGNTATGVNALRNNTTGNFNTATAQNALLENTIGGYNAAIGYNALDANTTGNFNTAIGVGALGGNTIGSNNTAIGFSAGNQITGDNNIDIGNEGVGDESGVIRIGTAGTHTATFIAGIRETPLAQGVAMAVGITADGQLGVRASSERFKEAIKPMDKTSEAIFSLQPVTFRYKKAFDSQALPQFGLVAEQVAKVNPDLVARDAEGKPFTVRYDEVNAMLLNEFLKEHGKVEQLKTTVSEQEKQIAMLTASLKEQGAQIQKVSAQLGVNKQSLQTVAANH